MGAIIAALIGQFWPYILAGVMALAGIWTAYSKGKASQKAKLDAERLAARSEADKIDQAVAGMTDAEVLKEQAKWSRRKS
ncbi:hypothetical protein [Mesorhizobium sp. M0816]|uniref:hypothetical protein n=1 Tax=Mesorhizobium sp. M0816 TaxID=2957006 RepID=UPI00333617BB